MLLKIEPNPAHYRTVVLSYDRTLSFISLQGQYRSGVRCTTCGYESVNFSPFMFMSVPLDASKQRESLNTCLNRFSATERLSLRDQWYGG